VAHLEENVAASGLSLTREDNAELDAATNACGSPKSIASSATAPDGSNRFIEEHSRDAQELGF
jgi:hypothetical protein